MSDVQLPVDGNGVRQLRRVVRSRRLVLSGQAGDEQLTRRVELLYARRMPAARRTIIEASVPKTPLRGDPSWSRLLIVEGTSGVGKSTLIDRLIRRYVAEQPERRLRTILHLTQAHTYGPIAPDEDLGT